MMRFKLFHLMVITTWSCFLSTGLYALTSLDRMPPQEKQIAIANDEMPYFVQWMIGWVGAAAIPLWYLDKRI